MYTTIWSRTLGLDTCSWASRILAECVTTDSAEINSGVTYHARCTSIVSRISYSLHMLGVVLDFMLE